MGKPMSTPSSLKQKQVHSIALKGARHERFAVSERLELVLLPLATGRIRDRA